VRVIIAGSRNITDYNIMKDAVKKSNFVIDTIISGGARGVDSLAEEYARYYNIPLDVMKADWDKHGKSAGYKRNVEMAKSAEALIAVWDGESKGTKHMIDIAEERGLKIFVFQI
jgi:hypothetical protein